MEKYKYQFNRIEVDANHAERLQDFDRLLSRSFRHNKFQVLKKTLLYSALITGTAIGIFAVTEMLENRANLSEHKNHKLNDPILIEKKNPEQKELPAPLTPEIQKPDSVPAKEPKPESQKNDSNGTQTTQKTDLHKIREEPIEKDIFLEAEPLEGFDKFYEYLERSFVISTDLELNEGSKSVIVSFSISETGEARNIRVEKPVHPALDSIAIECIKNMPAWKPATLNGEPIETNHKIPLYFQNFTNE